MEGHAIAPNVTNNVDCQGSCPIPIFFLVKDPHESHSHHASKRDLPKGIPAGHRERAT